MTYSSLKAALFLIFIVSLQVILAGPLTDSTEIDVVYTWVDGSDEEWGKERRKWMVEENLPTNDATGTQRFRDRDELRYSMRSIEQFAPFIRKIFIVTNGQVPRWLKLHPKVQIVTHKEIFTNQKFLPTFNSMAIECHLHNIPGLSEQYVYFNDDVFLGRKITSADLYNSKGKPRLFFSKRAIPEGLPEVDETCYLAASKNTNLLLNGLYGRETRYQHCHTAYPLLKSVVKSIEEKFFHIFQLVASHRFRSVNDYTITNGLIPYVSKQMRFAEKSAPSALTISYGKDMRVDLQKMNELKSSRPIFFCIQDSVPELSEQQIKLFTDFLQSYYPIPAPWEIIELE